MIGVLEIRVLIGLLIVLCLIAKLLYEILKEL